MHATANHPDLKKKRLYKVQQIFSEEQYHKTRKTIYLYIKSQKKTSCGDTRNWVFLQDEDLKQKKYFVKIKD